MKNDQTLFLTGLRGYAAFSVFFIHASGGGITQLGEWARKIVDNGKYGVICFFVLSALTLAMSIDRSKQFSYPHYLTRRVARIVPMYFLVILVCWLLGGYSYYQEMFSVPVRDGYDLLLHLSFMNLWDVVYQGTIIGVEWTVPIEMWIYLIIPPLFFWLKKRHAVWKWGLFIFSIAVAAQAKHWHAHWLGAHWAIESYLYCFVAGLLAYGYWYKLTLSSRVADGLVLLLLLGMVFPAGGGSIRELWYTLLTMALVLALSNALYTRILFENRMVVWLGNISFPFYLIHFPVLQYLKKQLFSPLIVMLAGLLITAAISYMCHIWIERPALRMTGRLHPYDS